MLPALKGSKCYRQDGGKLSSTVGCSQEGVNSTRVGLGKTGFKQDS